MAGTSALRKIQIGKETTAGTAVVATARLLGKMSMKQAQDMFKWEFDSGSFSQYTQLPEVLAINAALKWDGVVTFEQLLYFLLMGVKGGVTGVVQGGTAAYLWTFTPSLIAVNTGTTFTIEAGDDTQAWEAEYCLASKLELSGKANQPLQLSADIFGRQLVATAFTSSLNPPTVETAKFNKTKLFIDPTWATLGTTEKAGILRSFKLTLPSGFKPFHAADGNLFFNTAYEVGRQITLEMTLAFESAVNTERANWTTPARRAIRLECTGSLIASTYYKKVTMDLLCAYDEWSELGEEDGKDIVNVKLISSGDVANNQMFSIAVQNTVTTLP